MSNRQEKVQYCVERSPLYRLQNKRRFAELLQIPLAELNSLLRNGEANFRPHTIPKGDGSLRYLEIPKDVLKRLHRRLLQLLSRIETPGYLHSAKGRSYLTNALQHVGDHPIAKMNIKKFVPSTTFDHIRRGFSKVFECSPDVAYLIARLCTYGKHVPTGSSISCLVAYYAHKPLFDALNQIATKKGWVLTCYVDDITVSGVAVNRRTVALLKKEIAAHGLICHKEYVCCAHRPKMVTGVIITGAQLKLPNKRQKLLYDTLDQFQKESDLLRRTRLIAELTGRANEAAQVDSGFALRRRWFHSLAHSREASHS
jgi:hypothetical protein